MASTISRCRAHHDLSEEGIQHALEYWEQTPYGPARTDAQGPEDWGESPRDCRLRLRAKDTEGRPIGLGDMQSGDWGVYLGLHGGKQVILVHKLGGLPMGLAKYGTVEEMKSEWQLD